MVFSHITSGKRHIDQWADDLLHIEGLPAFAVECARYLSALSCNESPELFASIVLLVKSNLDGDTCLDLLSIDPGDINLLAKAMRCEMQPLERWPSILSAVPVVGISGDYKTLILENNRLYLQKYWVYENDCIAGFRDRGCVKLLELETDPKRLAKAIDTFFPVDAESGIAQKIAALRSVACRLSIITGGPGTGKTTAIVNIIRLYSQLYPDGVRIVLAAPTGKAVGRLQEAIASLPADGSLGKTSLSVKTLHRLLGSKRTGTGFEYGKKRKLPVDLLVVDEASMIDLTIMAHLFYALPEKAHLILVGDRDQLSSIRTGSVFGSVCATSSTDSFSYSTAQKIGGIFPGLFNLTINSENTLPLAECITQFTKTYRFSKEIGEYALAIRSGNAETFFSRQEFSEDKRNNSAVEWREYRSDEQVYELVIREIEKTWDRYFAATDVSELFNQFRQFRILCGLRSGPLGVESINRLIEQWLKRKGLAGRDECHYFRKPVMILENDYRAGLYNGDIGIMAPDHTPDETMGVWFPPANNDEKGALRRFNIGSIPSFETSFCMTIHKSQGSEFGRVLLILPVQSTPLFTRELAYTGLTRSRESVLIVGNRSLFFEAIKKTTSRASGLYEKLKTSPQLTTFP